MRRNDKKPFFKGIIEPEIIYTTTEMLKILGISFRIIDNEIQISHSEDLALNIYSIIQKYIIEEYGFELDDF